MIARTEDDFLVAQKMQKGGMALIDEARAKAIYDAMGPAIGDFRRLGGQHHRRVASFGARAPLSARSRMTRSAAFRHDIRKAG